MSTRVHYVMAYVADMDRATRFYRDALGLPLKFSSPYWTEFATGQTTLALHPAGADHQAGTFGLGLRVPDLAAFCDEMAAQGVECAMPPTTQFGATLARFRDADGSEFTVAADLSPDAASGGWETGQ